MTGPCLRKVTPNDVHTLWEWANDPVTRQMAFNSAPISWHQHQQWFAGKMADSNCIWYILENEVGKPAAQVRFDLDAPGDAVVDLTVAPEQRGHGHGIRVLDLATHALLSELPHVSQAVGYIKTQNSASRRAFAKANYSQVAVQVINGVEIVKMVYPRPDKGDKT